MLKWLIGGGLGAWALYRILSSGDEEPSSPTTVRWVDPSGAPKQQHFELRSVAEQFVHALASAGATSIQIDAIV